jgi:hypothetical protein
MVSESTVAVDQDLQSCRATAYTHGLERALVALHDRVGVPAAMVGPGGYSILPPSLLELLSGVNDPVARQATDTGELVIAKAEARPHQPSAQWSMGVAWIRLGAVERLNKRATDRLAGRRVQGRPTISMPLVRACVGDIAAAVAEARYLLADDTDGDLPRMRGRLDEILDFAVRASLKLFGASGYVLGPPANLAYAITYLGEVYGSPDPGRPQ